MKMSQKILNINGKNNPVEYIKLYKFRVYPLAAGQAPDLYIFLYKNLICANNIIR